jgi:hypothetical protein
MLGMLPTDNQHVFSVSGLPNIHVGNHGYFEFPNPRPGSRDLVIRVA